MIRYVCILGVVLVVGLSGGAWGQVGDPRVSNYGCPAAQYFDSSDRECHNSWVQSNPRDYQIICQGTTPCDPLRNDGSYVAPHYTLDEIDRMRTAEKKMATIIHDCVSTANVACISRWFEVPTDAVVEDRLRTYIAAGIRPEELEAKVK